MDELLVERYTLASERVREVMDEKLVPEPYQDFFRKTAAFLSQTVQVMNGSGKDLSMEEWKNLNHQLYEDILPEITKPATEIRFTPARSLGNMERILPSSMQS